LILSIYKNSFIETKGLMKINPDLKIVSLSFLGNALLEEKYDLAKYDFDFPTLFLEFLLIPVENQTFRLFIFPSLKKVRRKKGIFLC